jgi:hypothetical protein
LSHEVKNEILVVYPALAVAQNLRYLICEYIEAVAGDQESVERRKGVATMKVIRVRSSEEMF